MMTVIIGGSGSGKSAFAEALVRKLKGERIYLATMAAGDPESLRRIARHRKQREHLGFATVEQPLRLFDAVIPAGANVYTVSLTTYWNDGHEAPAAESATVRVTGGVALPLLVFGQVAAMQTRQFKAHFCLAATLSVAAGELVAIRMPIKATIYFFMTAQFPLFVFHRFDFIV